MEGKGREEYDVVVIGGGVVGCAVARELTKRGVRRIILIEKNQTVVNEASGGNSGIFHTGFDAPTGSIEHQCMVNGHKLFVQLQKNNNFRRKVKFEMNGALLVAWSEEEESKFPEIIQKAKKNGVFVKSITQSELRTLEPNISHLARSAVWIPSEAITDPNLLAIYYLSEALERGCQLLLSNELIAATFYKEEQSWELKCKRKMSIMGEENFTHIRTKFVINCAGNYGDLVESILLGNAAPFTVTPRKGQFAVFDCSASQIVRGIVLPVPTERTKGILVSRTVYGTVIVGPTAEDQEERDVATVDDRTINGLIERAYEIFPPLIHSKVIGKYAGLRPSTQHRDYQIRSVNDKQYICCGGIRSTGLTASLGIAEYTVNLLDDLFADDRLRSLKSSVYLSNEDLVIREKIAEIASSTSLWSICPSTYSLRFSVTNYDRNANNNCDVYLSLAHSLYRISTNELRSKL